MGMGKTAGDRKTSTRILARLVVVALVAAVSRPPAAHAGRFTDAVAKEVKKSTEKPAPSEKPAESRPSWVASLAADILASAVDSLLRPNPTQTYSSAPSTEPAYAPVYGSACTQYTPPLGARPGDEPVPAGSEPAGARRLWCGPSVGLGAVALPQGLREALGNPGMGIQPAATVGLSLLASGIDRRTMLGVHVQFASVPEAVPGIGVEQYQIGGSVVRFLGSQAGRGTFLRLDAGLSWVTVSIDREDFISSVTSPFGVGMRGGVGYAWPVGPTTSVALESMANYQLVDGDRYTSFTTSLGVMF